MAQKKELSIHLLRHADRQILQSSGAHVAWLFDQPSPFGGDASAPLFGCVLATDRGEKPDIADYSYDAELVLGKAGPPGAISLLAFVTAARGVTHEEAFRHWNEHIPLAVEIHHKALSYRQYRLRRPLSPEAPDYFGMAVLGFASDDDVRTGLYRTEKDKQTIAKDVDEFVGAADVLFGTEHIIKG